MTLDAPFLIVPSSLPSSAPQGGVMTLCHMYRNFTYFSCGGGLIFIGLLYQGYRLFRTGFFNEDAVDVDSNGMAV